MRGEPEARRWEFQELAHVAQMVERVLGKDEVTSSILVVGSRRGDGGPTLKTGRE